MTRIINVNEISESTRDHNVGLFVDLDRLDPEVETDNNFLRVIKAAMADDGKVASIDAEDSYSYGEINSDVLVDPPCHVEDSITLYVQD